MKDYITTSAVEEALNEIIMDREFTLASGPSSSGGRKILTYAPGRKVFTVKETTAKDLECGTAEMAATIYSER